MFIPIIPYLYRWHDHFFLQDTDDYIIERVNHEVYRRYGVQQYRGIKVEYPDITMSAGNSIIHYCDREYIFSFVKGLYLRVDGGGLECLFTCKTEPGEFSILYCEKVSKCILVRCIFTTLVTLECVFITLVFYDNEFKGYYFSSKFEIIANEKYVLEQSLVSRLMLTDSVLLSKGNNRY